jgi:quercetin dioxygenase-like cupin family protein
MMAPSLVGIPPGGAREEGIMLTRREFAGIAGCALCGITELAATGAAAAEGTGAPAATTPGVNRKILSRQDGPAPGYETIQVEATIEKGVKVARHTHPGIEASYVVEGRFELPVQGRETMTVKAGDAFQIPPETPHAGGAPTAETSKIMITYIVEKGKPLASPA